jgi:hypothetical protein
LRRNRRDDGCRITQCPCCRLDNNAARRKPRQRHRLQQRSWRSVRETRVDAYEAVLGDHCEPRACHVGGRGCSDFRKDTRQEGVERAARTFQVNNAMVVMATVACRMVVVARHVPHVTGGVPGNRLPKWHDTRELGDHKEADQPGNQRANRR